jgi:electron transport complex protein RnfB
VLCRGDSENCVSKYRYTGVNDCRAAAALAGGPKSCPFGCVGLLTCGRACPFGAIFLSDKGIAEVDEEKCTGCGNCVAVCPKHCFTLMPQSRSVYVTCRTTKKGKAVTEACKAGCIACGLCAKKCPAGAITIVDNLRGIDYEKCTACGTCAAVCPKGAIFAPNTDEVKAALGK